VRETLWPSSPTIFILSISLQKSFLTTYILHTYVYIYIRLYYFHDYIKCRDVYLNKYTLYTYFKSAYALVCLYMQIHAREKVTITIHYLLSAMHFTCMRFY
jgi:hypothetical protein